MVVIFQEVSGTGLGVDLKRCDVKRTTLIKRNRVKMILTIITTLLYIDGHNN